VNSQSRNSPDTRHHLQRFYTAIIGVVLVSVCVPVAATSDLLSVLGAAEQMDPLYREAQRRALVTAEGIPQARAALWFPTLSFRAGADRVRQSIKTESSVGAGGKVAFSTHNYRIEMEQPIYHHDRFVALAQASKKLQKSQVDVLVAHQDLMLRVAERYFDVLATRDSLAFASAEKQSLQSQLEQAQQRFDVGLIAITDVQEAQAGYDRALASEIRARNDIENANEALREITADYHLELKVLGEDMSLTIPEPQDIDAWTSTALGNNLKLSSSLIAAEIAHHDIRSEFSQHFPTIDLVGGHGFNKQGGRFGATNIHQSDVGIALNVQIFEGGRTLSRTREATHEHGVALEQLEQTRRSIYRETRQAYLGVIAEISSVKALRQAVFSSHTALESTRAGFEVGTRTAIDVVAAERVLSQAKRDYSRARYDYIVETLRLKQAAGSLSPDDLAWANAWLIDTAENRSPTGNSESSEMGIN